MSPGTSQGAGVLSPEGANSVDSEYILTTVPRGRDPGNGRTA